MARPITHPLPPPTVQRRFTFTKNLYRQLTCVSSIRLSLGIISVIFGILEQVLGSRYHETWHLLVSGFLYIFASLLALLGSSYPSIVRYRLLWLHSWISIFCCLFIYPAEIGLMSLELCHDTAWCLCTMKPRRSCPPNWRVVPLELASLFITTIVFILNLLAAVVSMKAWKATSARLERMRSSSCRRTLKRAKLEAEEAIATQQQFKPTNRLISNTDQRSSKMIEGDLRFLYVGAAAATAASAAAAPMFTSSKTVLERMNRPQTLLYPQKIDNDEEQQPDYDPCPLHWWKRQENFV